MMLTPEEVSRFRDTAVGLGASTDVFVRRPVQMLLQTLDAYAEVAQQLLVLVRERDAARRFGEDAAKWYNELLARQRADEADVACAFCGERYPKGTPRHGDGALTEHIWTCTKHPLRASEVALAAALEVISRLHQERAASIGALTALSACIRGRGEQP